MDYDLIGETIDLGSGRFVLTIFEVRTNKLLYQSPALDAGNCASAILHFHKLGKAYGYKVQIWVCEELVAAARKTALKLN